MHWTEIADFGPDTHCPYYTRVKLTLQLRFKLQPEVMLLFTVHPNDEQLLVGPS